MLLGIFTCIPLLIMKSICLLKHHWSKVFLYQQLHTHLHHNFSYQMDKSLETRGPLGHKLKVFARSSVCFFRTNLGNIAFVGNNFDYLTISPPCKSSTILNSFPLNQLWGMQVILACWIRLVMHGLFINKYFYQQIICSILTSQCRRLI